MAELLLTFLVTLLPAVLEIVRGNVSSFQRVLVWMFGVGNFLFLNWLVFDFTLKLSFSIITKPLNGRFLLIYTNLIRFFAFAWSMLFRCRHAHIINLTAETSNKTWRTTVGFEGFHLLSILTRFVFFAGCIWIDRLVRIMNALWLLGGLFCKWLLFWRVGIPILRGRVGLL